VRPPRLATRLAALAALAALGAAACAEEPPAAPPLTPYTVWVYDEAPSSLDEDAPLGGATVAFYPASGGARVVATTGPDGHATLLVDASAGPGRVNVVSPDHVLVTMLGASPSVSRRNDKGKPETELVVVPPRMDRANRARAVELTGQLLNKTEAKTFIDLSASSYRDLRSFQGALSSYRTRVPRGRPFFLLGHETRTLIDDGVTLENEHLRSFRFDLPARDEGGVLDLNLAAATQLATRTVRLRAEIPDALREVFGPGTRGYATVLSVDSDLLVGPVRRTKLADDGRAVDLETTVAETDIAPERVVTRASLVSPDGARSIRYELGVLADGAAVRDYLAPVRVKGEYQSFASPIPLDGFPEGAELVVEILIADRIAWVLHGPPGPAPPTLTLQVPLEVDLPTLLVATITARADRVALAPRGEVFRRVSVSRDLVLTR
jgi:hypothetical protein